MSNLQTIAAGELERYGYCPLSWWLGRNSDVGGPELTQGSREHAAFSSSMDSLQTKERTWQELRISFVISVAMVTNLIAVIIIGVSGMASEEKATWLFMTSTIWALIGGLLLYFSYRKVRWGTYTANEGMLIATSTLMMIVALNTIFLLQIEFITGGMYLVLAFIWLALTVVILALHHTLSGDIIGMRQDSSLQGEVVYIGENGKVLYSESLGLSGRPDLILREDDDMVPVEVKTGRVPRGPLFSHILQLGAYCAIITDMTGNRVDRGVLRYGNRDFDIEFDENLEELVLIKIEEMRGALRDGVVHRNHNRPGKCSNCSRRDGCPERLD